MRIYRSLAPELLTGSAPDPPVHGHQLPVPWRENRVWLDVLRIGVPFPCPAMQARLRMARVLCLEPGGDQHVEEARWLPERTRA